MYSISLFLHIVGALGIFAGLAVEQAALFNLRRASTTAQARDAVSLMNALRFMGSAALVLVVTGVYMMMTRWPNQGWAGLGLVGMVVIAIIGAAVTGRRMKPLTQALFADTKDGPLTAAVRDRIADPALRMSAWTRLGLALGIVFNMSVKPAPGSAMIALIVGTALGALAARVGRAERPAAGVRVTG